MHCRFITSSVHRTPDSQALFHGVSHAGSVGNDKIFKDELIPSAISATRGKVKEVPILSFVRFLNPAAYRQLWVHDWITDPNWYHSYQYFRNRLTEELVRQDGISQEETQQVIKRTLWPYLARSLSSHWQKYNSQLASTNGGSPMNIRRMARRVPGLRAPWRNARSRVRSLRGDDTWLTALLNPSSPYHQDFMPVYRAITTPPAEVFDESVTGKTS
jgi:hypothetical protein